MNSLALSKELASNPIAMQNLADLSDKEFEIMGRKYTPSRKKNQLKDVIDKYSKDQIKNAYFWHKYFSLSLLLITYDTRQTRSAFTSNKQDWQRHTVLLYGKRYTFRG